MDRQIKLLIDEGQEAFDTNPVTDLLNNLLYYVARSGNAGPRISEIRAAFNLSELLPGDEQVEHARESLSAPSVKLMQTVASAIKEDLSRVKDVLDIYVRTGMTKASELVPQLDLLKKISDTLGVLGLGALRGDIDGEIGRLRDVVERGGGTNEQTILEIAATLLRVEDRLDLQLTQLIVPRDPVSEAEPAISDEDEADFKKVTEAVMRESIINLARIKETFSQAMSEHSDSSGIDSVPALVRGIKAGLLMLEKTRAMDVVERVGELFVLALAGKGPSQLTQKETDRLADAIVSIEYYMETVRAGRKEPWYMLDNAEACLGVLQETVNRLRVEIGEHPGSTATAEVPVEKAPEPTPPPGKLQATDVLKAPVVAQDAEHLDPELLELFIEEAKEEIVSINRSLPLWAEAPDDMEALITVRRSFHTLKGSGRMVGAERIGEYCWAVENLLNKLINRTLVRTPPMVQFVVEAAGVVPELIEQLEVGTEPGADVALMTARANAFADGDPNAAVLTLAQDSSSEVPEESAALEMDPVLLDIFAKETTGHLQVVRSYVNACEAHEPPYPITDKLYRACHTLHGSTNMANVERGVQVAGALNRFVRRLYDHKIGVDAQGLKALSTAAAAIDAIVGDINRPERTRTDYSPLIQHLDALTNAIEQPVDVEPEPIEEVPLPAEPEDDELDAEYDAEIAAIFSEEAAELLEAADQALTSWSTDKNARNQLNALKRHLHTLKGGARMAGITAMGNLSHELESLLNGVDGGRIETSPALDELLQQSVDELHRMRDIVIAGKRVSSAAELEERIRTANAGGDVAPLTAALPREAPAEDAPADADDSVSVEFTVEPEETVSMVIVDTDEDEAEEVDLELIEDFDNAALAEHPTEPDIADTPPVEPMPVEPEAHAEALIDAIPDEPETEPPADESPAEPMAAPAAAERRQPPRQAPEQRQEFARIDAVLLEDLLNAAGEISIYHSRLSQQISSIEFNLEEVEQTVSRLREQLRKLEIETEAQIMHGHQDTLVARDFDPLEMDRYSNIQQLSRALAESANDMGSLKELLQSQTSEAETLLVQQARVTAELQNGLMRTRMVPFQRHVPRLTRLVRQAAVEVGKRAELAVEGAAGELDRQVLDKMLPPFEHMLRNAIVHGIESAELRQAAGKPAAGRITIRLHREGAEMVIDVADDGAGLNVDSIRRKAFEQGLLKPDAKASDAEIMDLILRPGFSTATTVTQSAGRGVGMDVVANEVKQLGGSLQISSVTGQGTNFTVRLPFTLAITQALIVRTGEEVYALPLPTVE
ncbi:MAG: Hpt domain-containing protein, partial [Pseudomonadota bacterium]